MNQTEQRAVAIGAVRSEARHHGDDPMELTADNAWSILDDIYRQNHKLIASIWYINSSENQMKLFDQDWRAWQKEQSCVNKI